METRVNIGVIGAGSWGTTLADLLAKKGHRVTLWAYEAELADEIRRNHTNSLYLQGFKLHPALSSITDRSPLPQMEDP